MRKKVQTGRVATNDRAISEELDALNAEVRERGPRELRRHIEGRIEKQARDRRRTEKPASSGFKRT